ncbi:tetratricopeptide repeat protein 1 [Momordica charantia]|uniref:Tetratricopeptide repeat protein 1 n=1 Tax=Momordica charantia TaxID=3673 RepID=A0A6J1DGP0_MOMCH|nr:tetratricopeptide repeat protein 1 [Momordica charantia]
MVRIEMEETEDAVPSPPKASASTTKTMDSSGGASTSNATKDPSDGFETASDGELGDSGDERQEHPDQHPQEEEKIPELTEDEIKEKALAEANSAKLAGNKLFGEGKYEEAILEYDRALQIAPDMPSAVELRSICHGNRGVCFLKLEKYNDTIKECTKAIELNPAYIKALSRRGEAHEKLENFEEAIHDMKKILELDSSNVQARKAICRLEPLAEQKREKMKEEMIGKLKDVGNSLLGRFGMSVDNFKAVKDPNTGSYSISFQR